MDSKLCNSMEDFEQFYTSRMLNYEERLQQALCSSLPVHTDLEKLSKDFSDFKLFITEIISKLKAHMELLTLGLDRHETKMRGKILLLHGVPEKDNEKLCESVHNIFNGKMGLSDINLHSFDVCHRLGASQGKTRPVLVRFHDMEHRRLVWDSKKALKDSGITVSEFLTKARHRVFLAARKHFGIRSCWSVEGKITILTPDKSRHKIETLSELEKLSARFPSNTVIAGDASTQRDARSSKAPEATAAGKAIRRARRGH